MAIRTWNGRDIPEKGIEQASLTLLYAHHKMRGEEKVKYHNAVNYGAWVTATELINDMGYGQTKSEVGSIVADVYNEHGVKGWQELAAQLTAVYRGRN